MMRAMKDSRIEWIGMIPEEWELRKLKAVITCKDGQRVPIDASQRKSGIYPYWGAGSITDYVDSYLFDEKLVLLGEDGAPFFDKKRNVAFLINEKVWVNNHIHVLKADKMVVPEYLVHYLNIVDFGSYINGSILNKLTQSNMNNINIAFPNKVEQVKIAEFLNDKVGEIDKIISKTKDSIEEYKEYKKSVITDTITKGVRKAPLRTTGNVHIPKIPAHWQMKRIKYIFEIKKDIAGKEGFDILSITQKGIKVKDISKNEGQLAQNYSNYQLVDIGDFAMNHMDLLTGWVDISKYAGVTSPDYRVFRFIDKAGYDADYYLYLMQMCYMNKIFYGLGQGVSNLGRWRLQADKFLNFSIPEPPLTEQQEIAKYLSARCGEIDALIAKKEAFVEEMEIYKKSLIYEYVTGKKEVK